MRILISVIILSAAISAPASAQVVLDQWGSYATILTSDCSDFCDPEVDLLWLLGLTFEVTNMSVALDSIDASASNTRGDAFAEASVAVPLVPSVRVDANANASGWVDGTGTAVQGFTYTGAVPDTIDVNVRLTGTIGNPDADPSTGLAAQVSYIGNARVASVVFENAVIGLISPDGAVALEQTADGPVDLSDVLSIPAAPGDQFYLIVSSAASAGGANAFAESLGTLTASFDPADAANLTPASAPAPVPTMSRVGMALLVVVVSVVAFGWSRRQRRTMDAEVAPRIT